MKVVGLSGAQGAGKSTLLIELQKRGWVLDQFRVSRAVQAQLGWDSLDQVMESWDTMTAFQEEVFKQKLGRDVELMKLSDDARHDRTVSQNAIILTERTFADIVAYTNLWTWKHVDRRNVDLSTAVRWLQAYTHGCLQAQVQIYSGVMLLPYMSDVVSWEADKNRADRIDTDKVYEDVERFLEQSLLMKVRRQVITTKTVDERADQVERYLETL